MSNAPFQSCPWWEMTPADVRDKINQRIMQIEAPIPLVKTVMNVVIKGNITNTSIPIRLYTPFGSGIHPIILLIHGGAWVGGNLDTHDNLARYLCAEAEALVVSVGYLNPPEGKFPLPLQQCFEALLWIIKHANEVNADSSRLAVVGDSAGANMAAALCLMVKDVSGLKILLQVLINPAPDLSCNGTIERQNDSLDSLRWQATQYLLSSDETTHPYVSPLLADDLSGLPPAIVILAEKDVLREAGQQYAERLISANVPTTVYCQQGSDHLAGHGARASLQAKESLDVVVTALRCAFKQSQADL